jgi:hypothetical protein
MKQFLPVAAIVASVAALVPAVRAQTPCCTVTAIDARRATAIAKVNATGQTFEFRVADPKLLSGLRVGQPIYANFATRQVSLNGRTPCGTITAGPSPSAAPTGIATTVADKLHHPPNYGPVVAAHGCPAVSDAPDLLITMLGFDATRHMTYTVANCGHTSTQLPFIMDLYFNNTRGDTVEHPVLPPLSQQTVTSQLAQYQACDRVTLRAVVDPQQIVTESNEGNNQKVADATPLCPDLAVDEIKQDWEDANTRYRVQITIKNHGNAPTGQTVTARVNTNPSSGSIPEALFYDIPALAPGQSHTFHLPAKYLLSTSVSVDILVDYYYRVLEIREDNNYMHKILGPH